MLRKFHKPKSLIIFMIAAFVFQIGIGKSTKEEIRIVFEIIDESNPITSSVWSPTKNQTAITTEDGRIQIFDIESQRKVIELPASFRWVRAPSWDHDGNLFAYFSTRNSITILNSGFQQVTVLEFSASQESSLWWSPRSELVAFPDTQGQMQIWDSTIWTNSTIDINSEAELWDQHEDRLALFDDQSQTLDLWDLKASSRLYPLLEQSNPLSELVFNDDGSLLATIDNIYVSSEFFIDEPSIRIWNIDSRQIIQSFTLTTGGQIYWSPVDNRFATILDITNRLYIVDGQRQQTSLEVDSTRYIVPGSVTWSLDGQYIVFATNLIPTSDSRTEDVQLRVIGSNTLELLDQHQIPYEPRFASWSFDGKYLLLLSNIVQIVQAFG